MTSFRTVFFVVVSEEENNLDESIEYRKAVTKFAHKVFHRWEEIK